MAAERWISNTVEVPPPPNPSLDHFTSLAHDQPALPDIWIQFQRMALIGQLSHYLMHDILQPLTSICNFSSGILIQVSNNALPPKKLSTALSSINQEAFRASSIAKQLRNQSRSNADDYSKIEVSALIRQMLELIGGFLRLEQVVVKAVFTDDLPSVFASGLEQVILNLIKNAAEAMQTIPPQSRTIEIKTRKELGSIVISIEDAGPRIPEDVLMNLSRPFFTTKVAAMGMGLWASKAILRRNLGELLLRQRAPQGLEAIIRLPIATDD